MARPSQAITYPEVFMSKYGDRPRGFVPSSAPARPNVDMGGDEHGWYADAVKVANDRVKQIASSKNMYLNGVRPFQRLGLVRNKGTIAPFGVNSVGGQFVESASKYGGSGELRGGIMFTEAGQNYLQELLNKRQKQYAEMYGDTNVRSQPNSYTDIADGDKELALVQPLYNDLLDDLRLFKIKGIEESYKKWWAMMLTALPLLGANFRSKINEIYLTLGEALDGYVVNLQSSEQLSNPKDNATFNSIIERLERSLEVMNVYIGSTGTINGEQDPIDAPAELRQKIVDELNKKIGTKVASTLLKQARMMMGSLLSGAITIDTAPWDDEGDSRVVEENRAELEPFDANGEFRPRTGRLSERPSVATANTSVALPLSRQAIEQELRDQGHAGIALGRPNLQTGSMRTAVSAGLPARLRQQGMGDMGRRALPSGEIGTASVVSAPVRRPVPEVIEGQGRHNFHRKIVPMASHHRLLNKRNER